MRQAYNNPVMRELALQLRFAPQQRRLEQLNRAEALLHELEPGQTYSYSFICQRITGFRPESHAEVRLQGAEALADVRRLIEDVSAEVVLPVEAAGERVLTVDELSKLLHVSTKTISRWRRQGLVSRRFVFDGRTRLGFLQSTVDRFVADNKERVMRSARFSQMTDEERSGIVERARRLAQHGGTPSEVVRRVARWSGRSVEAVRYTLRAFDREHPEVAVFPQHTGPLDEATKQKIFQAHRRGESVEALALKYHRTKTSIYRILNEVRAKRIMELPLDYIPNPMFAKPNAAAIILGPMPEGEPASKRPPKLPSGLPPYLASLYEVPLLTREQEVYLFRKFNFLKYQASKLRETLDPARAKASVMDRIEQLYNEAVETKNQIIRANLRLVVSIAKRHVGPAEDFFELVSDGNMSLIRAIEKFDFTKGFKFSTYASWAIMKNYARSIPDELRHRDRFRTSTDEMFAATKDERSDEYEQELAQAQREAQIGKILERLDEREQRIIRSRFGLGPGQEPLTLKEVGEEMGVTKERVRQIEARALSKLRQAAEEEHIELPN